MKAIDKIRRFVEWSRHPDSQPACQSYEREGISCVDLKFADVEVKLLRELVDELDAAAKPSFDCGPSAPVHITLFCGVVGILEARFPNRAAIPHVINAMASHLQEVQQLYASLPQVTPAEDPPTAPAA